jgi:hypothetical protein
MTLAVLPLVLERTGPSCAILLIKWLHVEKLRLLVWLRNFYGFRPRD